MAQVNDDSLYYRCLKGEVDYIFDNDKPFFTIKRNSIVSFASYYNYFSLNTWFRYCNFSELKFFIKGTGKFVLKFFSKSNNSPDILVDSFNVNLTPNQFFSCSLNITAPMQYSALYCRVESKSNTSLHSMCFYVDDTPVNEIKLGIVITHFNRKQYVVPAMKRISSKLFSDDYFRQRMELVVIDNSKNITISESYGSKVIPNDNLGGSGGFTRGLIYLKENGFSHCLFMDDDACCELESIKRTFRLLQFSSRERLAISGGMLYEHMPTVLHEKGAKFNKLKFISLRNGTDVSDFNNVVLLDSLPEKISYGAWWFFAFKISDVSAYPFPFFVKADDMLFGLLNNFNIISPNGIAVWGEDFGYKDGPLQRYLVTRGKLAASLIVRQSSVLRILSDFMRSVISMLLSYRYSSAQAICLGMIDFMKGPSWWVNNMSFNEILKSISGCLNDEKMEPVELCNYDIEHKSIHESRYRRFLRLITLNGVLLPDILIRKNYVINEKSGCGIFRIIFRSKYVIYFQSATGKGYITQLNRLRFFKQLVSALIISIKFVFKYKHLVKSYSGDAKKIMTEEFWLNVYKE